jgi:hypothetical protein
LLRQELQTKGFDGDEPVALRIVRAKNRSQNAAADLVQDAIRAEGRGRGKSGRFVERQRGLLI